MGILIQYISLFFGIILVETLHMSVFQYGHIVIAFLLFLVFFFRPQQALVSALIMGILEDSVTSPFGFHMIIYPLISFGGIVVCSVLLTNKSFLAFFLLGMGGFFTYQLLGILSLLTHDLMRQEIFSLHDFFSFTYAREILYGFLMQSVLLLFLYGIQYRRIKFSRAYLMFSE